MGNLETLVSLTNSTATFSKLLVVGIEDATSPINKNIIIEIAINDYNAIPVNIANFGTISNLEFYLYYNRFIQYIGEIAGVNNVQLANRSYTETVAYISAQHGQIPYTLFRTKDDNNYKPNLQFPIIASEIQAEIQGGEVPTNPILINPSLYPGDIWGQFDDAGYLYTTETGDTIRRYGNYYGNQAVSNLALNNLLYPTFDGATIDGITLDLDINDYAEAVSYLYPIDTFSEFSGTSFNNVAPKDFEFNAIIWYYTIQDTSGNTLKTATNIYGIEFLDNPDNDLLYNKLKIPTDTKLVSNGYQDGNAYTFSLDLNYTTESDTLPASFEPDKVYSLFGMELFYEAMTRLTYFNDQLTNLITTNTNLNNKINTLSGLVYNQQSLDIIRYRMNNIEQLLNVYATLQIGNSDTITSRLDTSVNPPLIRLDSVDKQYGYIYQYNTKDMFTEYVNFSGFTETTSIEKTIPITNGKDFLVIINNNDNSIPTIPYDTTIMLTPLEITIDKDLAYKQKIDIFILSIYSK